MSNPNDLPPLTSIVNDSRWLSVREAAAYIKATNWFMEELCRDRKIPYKRNGKKFVIDRQDLDAYMEAGKTAIVDAKVQQAFERAFSKVAA
ncbi:MAG: excisionase family DNA-binding protein [Candidatus Acidiferrum sp.]